MLASFAYNEIFGLPFIVWGGIGTFILFLCAAFIPLARRWKLINLPYEWHYRLAYIAIIFGAMHAIFGIFLNLNR